MAFRITYPSHRQGAPAFHRDATTLEEARVIGPVWAAEVLPDATVMEISDNAGQLIERWARGDGVWEIV